MIVIKTTWTTSVQHKFFLFVNIKRRKYNNGEEKNASQEKGNVRENLLFFSTLLFLRIGICIINYY